MQEIVRVKLSVEAYVREQFHRQMRPPSQCPNCGRFRRLWALGYYQRYTTGALGKVIAFLVRRFRCTCCRVTVSRLPCFAQPYRLVNHTTLEAFVKGRHRRRDVEAQRDLLRRYLFRFAEWRPKLLEIIRHHFGRASPKEDATAFWRRTVATCGSASKLTVLLVEQYGTTCFTTYRCHQAPFAQYPRYSPGLPGSRLSSGVRENGRRDIRQPGRAHYSQSGIGPGVSLSSTSGASSSFSCVNNRCLSRGSLPSSGTTLEL